MFNFLGSVIGNSLIATSLELIVQLILFYGVYKLGLLRSKLWQVICQQLALFLVLETSVQFFHVLNILYLGLIIPILVKIVIIAIVSIPLLYLWIVIPNLLIGHQQANRKRKRSIIKIRKPISKLNQEINKDSYAEVTTRLKNSLERLNESQPIRI
jgi:hypothetical protein